MTGDRHRYMRGVAFGAVAALAAVSCTRPGTGPRTTTTARPTTTVRPTTTTTTMDHGHGGMDHGHMPDRLNHAPTEEQKKSALAWVDATRKAVKDANLTVAKLQQMHYINIGDGVHWVKPEYTRDELQLEPTAVESFAVFGGQIAAAMYVYNPKGLNTTVNDVPDIAGTWTMWHNHVLPYRSNDPMSDDFFRLFGPYTRTDSPMVHVWLQPNKCGPFASAGVGEGSCIPELATY
jgi:hypothetical protein